jgi:hypothetical protein
MGATEGYFAAAEKSPREAVMREMHAIAEGRWDETGAKTRRALEGVAASFAADDGYNIDGRDAGLASEYTGRAKAEASGYAADALEALDADPAKAPGAAYAGIWGKFRKGRPRPPGDPADAGAQGAGCLSRGARRLRGMDGRGEVLCGGGVGTHVAAPAGDVP